MILMYIPYATELGHLQENLTILKTNGFTMHLRWGGSGNKTRNSYKKTSLSASPVNTSLWLDESFLLEIRSKI